jgi:hypothetical protein
VSATVLVRVRSDGLRLRVSDLREFLARWDDECEHMTTGEYNDANQAFVDIKISEVLFWRLLGGPVCLEAEVPVAVP